MPLPLFDDTSIASFVQMKVQKFLLKILSEINEIPKQQKIINVLYVRNGSKGRKNCNWWAGTNAEKRVRGNLCNLFLFTQVFGTEKLSKIIG